MRIITQGTRREVFGMKEKIGVDEDGTDHHVFLLSPTAKTVSGRRPVAQFDTEAELLAAANAKNCRVTWQTS